MLMQLLLPAVILAQNPAAPRPPATELTAGSLVDQ